MSSGYHQQEYGFSFGFGGITHTVQRLIMLTTAVFAAQLLTDIAFGDGFIGDTPGGLWVSDWMAYSSADLLRGYVWQPVSYIFLHGSLSHVFFNMLTLFFFGPEVERVLGSRQFLRFYLLCGVIGVLANLIPYALMNGRTNVVVVGASGATLGVLVAFAILQPDRRVFAFPFPFPITARMLVIVFVALNLLMAAGGGSGTSVATHFGGMITGFAYMKYRPMLNRRQWKRGAGKARRTSKKGKPGDDKIGEAVDNIFEFKKRDDG